MIRMLRIEIEKLFCSKRFYLGIVGIILGLQLTALGWLRYSMHETVGNLYRVSSGEAFSILSFVLCVVGGGISFCIEQKSHSTPYIVLRGNARNYAVGKVIAAFLGGYLTAFLGFWLGELSLSLTLYVQEGNWSGITSCLNQIGVDIFGILVMSLRYGIFSVTALLISVFIPDLFIVMVMPLVIYFAYLNIMGWFAGMMPRLLDMTYMVYGEYDVGEFTWNVFWGDLEKAVLFSLFVVYIMGCIIVKQMKRRVEHG